MASLASPPLLTPFSVHRINPFLVSHRRRRIAKVSAARFAHLKHRFFSVAAVPQNVFSSPETAKSFDFNSEERIYSWWESHGFFKPNFDQCGDPFVISMPPPNVTGSLHMGHAMFVTLEDVMVRYNRMKGRPTLWIPDTDYAVGCGTNACFPRNKEI